MRGDAFLARRRGVLFARQIGKGPFPPYLNDGAMFTCAQHACCAPCVVGGSVPSHAPCRGSAFDCKPSSKFCQVHTSISSLDVVLHLTLPYMVVAPSPPFLQLCGLTVSPLDNNEPGPNHSCQTFLNFMKMRVMVPESARVA